MVSNFMGDSAIVSAEVPTTTVQIRSMSGSRTALAVLAATLLLPMIAVGQSEPPESATQVDRASQNKPPFVFVETATADTQRLQKPSREQAARLARYSREAFTRGLMSVEDHAERMANVRQLELAATAKNDRRRRSAILIQQVDHWTHAVKHLASFRQPASGGWAADLAYARMMGAAAKSHLARQTQNRQQDIASTKRRAEFAARQFRYRLADLDVGLASLTQLAESLSQLRQTVAAAESVGLANADRSQLGDQLRRGAEKLRDRAELLQERSAGISRRDALQRVAYELALVEVHNSGDDDRKVSQLKSADTAAAEMLSAQHRVFAKGTSSLADLIRSWRLQREVDEAVQEIEKPDEPIRPNSRTVKELERLQVVAASIQDRRGRNAADVAYVANLKMQEEWKSIRAQQYAEQKRAYDKR